MRERLVAIGIAAIIGTTGGEAHAQTPIPTQPTIEATQQNNSKLDSSGPYLVLIAIGALGILQFASAIRQSMKSRRSRK